MLRFGQVVLNEEARELHLAGEARHLEPQAFDLLGYLVANRHRVVSKEELLEEVWGDQFVSESALTTRIKEIRRAVGDDGRTQGVIKNVRGRGYRFVAAVSASSEAPLDSRSDVALQAGVVLPAMPRLLGRDRDLVDALGALSESAVVSLLGPGGVGKTSLAIAIAHSVGGERPDGVVFVDLAAVADSAAVLPAIRHAAGLAAPVVSDAESIESVGALDGLLVLDNCEHLADTVVEIVDQLIAGDGPATVLLTSRERLGIANERVCTVHPLSEADARMLFIERVVRSQPEFVLSEADEPLLDRLLASIDYLPLAIEMAGGRLTAIGLNELTELLADRLDALRSPNRNVTERHRTLMDLVAWSEELLPPEERRLFADFSVFSGAVPIDDIAGVLTEDGADRLKIVDGLTALVDRSLVVADLNTRPATYRMLDTTRRYARSVSAGRVHRRHAMWFLEQADAADHDLRTVRESSANGWFARAMPEIRAAHGWAREHDVGLACRITGAVALFAHTRLRDEPARWAADLLARIGDDHPLTGVVASALAGDAAHRSDFVTATLMAERALAGSDVRAQIAALDALSDIALYKGDVDAVNRASAQLTKVSEGVGDLQGMSSGLAGRALLMVYGGDSEGGRDLVEAASFGEQLAPTDKGWLAYVVAESLAVDDPPAAIASYEHVIALAEPVDSKFLVSVSRVSLAAAVARHGEPDEAIERFRPILRGLQRDGNLTHAATTLRNLIELLVRLGMDEPAMTLLGALSDDDVKNTYGLEEERLSACRSQVESRAGIGPAARWAANGSGQGVRWALAFGRETLGDGSDGPSPTEMGGGL